MINTAKLATSWTKYHSVKIIEIIAEGDLRSYLDGSKTFEKSVLLSVLGIKSFSEPLPTYWVDIEKFPKQLRLFSLIATLSTNYAIIKKFSESSEKGAMSGIYTVEKNKVATNVRSALVVSGAALESNSGCSPL
jgi:hypothetical protein